MASLERIFLSKDNMRDISAYLKTDATMIMKSWAAKRNLDDYESVQLDYTEALGFINNEFVAMYEQQNDPKPVTYGQKFPKYRIKGGVEEYSPSDYRSHDAQLTQEVFRSNNNFRYGNKLKKWETSLYTRHYDREEHEHGLKDTRELETLERGFCTNGVVAPNPYKGSDTIIWGL
jgi:hypothetical protein